MSSSIRFYIFAFSCGLAALVAGYYGVLAAVPRYAFNREYSRLTLISAPNTMTHYIRADSSVAGFDGDPSSLVSVCPYDLGGGAVEVVSEVPSGSWFLLTAQAANGEHFYASDGESSLREGERRLRVVLLPRGAEEVPPGGGEVAYSPARRGLVVIRVLVEQEEDFPRLDSIRRRGVCGRAG